VGQALEVGVCAQHCNGGFAVDAWWESTIPHLFIVGELAGTHGVKRPGGSALNAGQVGGMRAAQRIAHVYHENAPPAGFGERARPVLERLAQEIERTKACPDRALDCAAEKRTIQHRMSQYAGMVRSLSGVEKALAEAQEQWRQIRDKGLAQKGENFMDALEVRELALAGRAFLEAILALLRRGSGSRGSHLVTDPSGELPHPRLGDEWRYIPENLELREEILSVRYELENDSFSSDATRPNPLPESDDWFESAWAEYREAKVFRKDNRERPRPCKEYQ